LYSAVQFCGSSVACERKGYSYFAVTVLAALANALATSPFCKTGPAGAASIVVAALAAKAAVENCFWASVDQTGLRTERARFATHQLSATITTASLAPLMS